MRPLYLWIAASCILALFVVRPIFSSGAPPASREKVIYSFSGGLDGAGPMSDLTIDAAGNLYGTTEYGGPEGCTIGCGVVFELKRADDGWKEVVLYSFTNKADSALPQAGVIFDNFGNLYGTTLGTVFKLTPNSRGEWTESVIYTFGQSSGGGPLGDLVFDTQGNLYGTTAFGANGSCSYQGCGAVFKLIPQNDGSWRETTLHVFTDADGDGAKPSSGVVLDSAGNVYGTTSYGGTGSCISGDPINGPTLGCGTIYKLHPSGERWTETVLYSFVHESGYGVYPSSPVFFDHPDHVLGLTKAGGDGLGTFFELKNTAKGWQRDNAHIFFGPPGDGYLPTGKLTADSAGNIVGVTSYGGALGNGTVFELRPLKNGWREKIVYSFGAAPDGTIPAAGLVSDSQGVLYGTTSRGGSFNRGTIYQLTP